MKNLKTITVKVMLVLAIFAGVFSANAQETSSPLVKEINNGNWLEENEAQELVDQLYLQRAIQAYYEMQPAMNTIGMEEGKEAAFGEGYNVVPVWKDRMDSRTWIPTPNADVIYSMGFFDLKETGPLVVAAPAKVIGMFTDYFQRTLTDVGVAGPDLGRGGLYLLLPPNYDGHIPAGYKAFESSTYQVFMFFRTVMKPGKNAADPTEAAAIAEKTRIYPLWDQEKNIPAMEFPNGSGKRVNMQYAIDYSYWTKMKDFVDYEPYSAIAPNLRGVLASIGIVKGEPFNPTARQKELLEEAVKTAPKMILAQRQLKRDDERDLYYADRQYERLWAGGTAEWMQNNYLDIDQRAKFFQFAYSSAPAMVMRTIDGGSKYPVTGTDGDGNLLNGSNNYKLHLPAGIPAKLFWAVTIYNVTDGTMPETDQLLPSKNQWDNIETNADGSIDLYFGPSLPEGAPESNYIKSIDGRNFICCIRLYGTGTEFFDQNWRPDDLVKLNK